jgi:hypothetical protein
MLKRCSPAEHFQIPGKLFFPTYSPLVQSSASFRYTFLTSVLHSHEGMMN